LFATVFRVDEGRFRLAEASLTGEAPFLRAVTFFTGDAIETGREAARGRVAFIHARSSSP
jgi:hypothetical protein